MSQWWAAIVVQQSSLSREGKIHEIAVGGYYVENYRVKTYYYGQTDRLRTSDQAVVQLMVKEKINYS